MRHLVKEADLDRQIEIDSAGTIAYHAGEPPDARAQAAARKRGIQVSGRARKWGRRDWDRFDYVLAMDQENYADLLQTAPDSATDKLSLLRSFDPGSGPNDPVPDPYYGGKDGFNHVIDLCEAACRGLRLHLPLTVAQFLRMHSKRK